MKISSVLYHNFEVSGKHILTHQAFAHMGQALESPLICVIKHTHLAWTKSKPSVCAL